MVLQAFFAQLMVRIQETGRWGQRGQALVEYGLMVALISMMAIAGLMAFQASTEKVYEKVILAAEAMVDSLK
jgi:Flp pilus assembly pilin Flp